MFAFSKTLTKRFQMGCNFDECKKPYGISQTFWTDWNDL